MIKNLETIVSQASAKGRKKLVVAVAQDEDVLKAVHQAVVKGLVSPVLVGNRNEIMEIAASAGIQTDDFTILDVKEKNAACAAAVRYVKEGNGHILMKGMVSTGQFVKTIIDKENGLLQGALLSHLAFFETPFYHKILCVTDAALNIAPDFNEKVSIVKNAVDTYHRLGIAIPLIAVLAAVETVNPKMDVTIHGAMLSQMQKRNQIEGCIIDGPLALDNAISADAAAHKGIVSDVAGDADILLTPDLNAGNILYKSLNFLGGAVCAAIVSGASVPVVLTSRADQDKSKFLSIALAVAMS